MMLNKLWEKGIRGKMHKMLKGIYSRTMNEVITEDGITKSFETGNEVRQGCSISPILFNPLTTMNYIFLTSVQGLILMTEKRI